MIRELKVSITPASALHINDDDTIYDIQPSNDLALACGRLVGSLPGWLVG